MGEVSTSKKNLLMIIPNYGYGGAQRVFSQLSSGLSDRYNLVNVVFNNDVKEVYPGVGKPISLDIDAGRTFLSKATKFLHRCMKLRLIKKQYNCVASVSHLEGANYINLLSFGPGRKIICVHGSKTAVDANRKGLYKFIEDRIFTPLLFALADRVVTVSHGIKMELIEVFKLSSNRISVIQNGIPIDDILELSKEELPSRFRGIFDKKVLVFSGRLAPQKNPVVAIDIYAGIEDKTALNLLIIGDGPLKSQMKDRCTELRISFYDYEENEGRETLAQVHFVGFQQNPFKFLKRSDVFISTSSFEGFPLAPCEALACELPIIATDCPTGTREILSPGSPLNYDLSEPDYVPYGILMPMVEPGAHQPMNIKMWSLTLQNLLGNQPLLNSYKSKSMVRAKELDERQVIQDWKVLLDSLV